ncbi:BA75_03076T0 [Komagataella pastoris]|uniref:BA75_03076T0 n=1 Tax=Komagataella pastoris TaxID=4922 RepID=A0A1B2JCN4_PICPA|nr:BA75_03076T0 [Komagataella pastoris]
MKLGIERRSNGISCSILAPLIENDVNSLVLVRHDRLEIQQYYDGKLHHLLDITINEKILCLKSIPVIKNDPSDRRHWMVCLTELNRLWLVAFSDSQNRFVVVDRVTFEGLKSEIFTMAITEDGNFIAISSVENFVHIMYLDPSKQQLYKQALEQNPPVGKINRTLKKNRVFLKPCNIYLADELIQNCHFLTDNILALIVRDSNLKYLVKYYRVVKHNSRFTELKCQLLRKFQPLPETPVLSIPLPNGCLMVLGEEIHSIYPSGKTIFKFENNASFGINKLAAVKVLTREFANLKAKITQRQIFTLFHVVDEHRVILGSNTGHYFLVSLDIYELPKTEEELEKEQELLSAQRQLDLEIESQEFYSISSWRFVHIGTSTIGNDMVHLEDQKFFISSTTDECLIVAIGRYEITKLLSLESGFLGPLTAGLCYEHGNILLAQGTISRSHLFEVNGRSIIIPGVIRKILLRGDLFYVLGLRELGSEIHSFIHILDQKLKIKHTKTYAEEMVDVVVHKHLYVSSNDHKSDQSVIKSFNFDLQKLKEVRVPIGTISKLATRGGFLVAVGSHLKIYNEQLEDQILFSVVGIATSSLSFFTDSKLLIGDFKLGVSCQDIDLDKPYIGSIKALPSDDKLSLCSLVCVLSDQSLLTSDAFGNINLYQKTEDGFILKSSLKIHESVTFICKGFNEPQIDSLEFEFVDENRSALRDCVAFFGTMSGDVYSIHN